MISNVDWVAAQQSKRLYVVGGTWRAIATAHAAQSRKRVDIVHGFTLTRKNLLRFLDTIEASEGEIEGIPRPPRQHGSGDQGAAWPDGSARHGKGCLFQLWRPRGHPFRRA